MKHCRNCGSEITYFYSGYGCGGRGDRFGCEKCDTLYKQISGGMFHIGPDIFEEDWMWTTSQYKIYCDPPACPTCSGKDCQICDGTGKVRAKSKTELATEKYLKTVVYCSFTGCQKCIKLVDDNQDDPEMPPVWGVPVGSNWAFIADFVARCPEHKNEKAC